MTDVLAVGAHPDDLELTLGGTAIVLVEKYRLEDRYTGSLVDERYAGPFRARRRLLVEDPTGFQPVRYG